MGFVIGVSGLIGILSPDKEEAAKKTKVKC
jgi:hypothetical protein